MELPKRKRNRLNGYDYSQNGAYFITICTHNREMILCNVGCGIIDAPTETKLTHIGEMVEKSINYIRKNNIDVIIDKFVIMPNHIHLIVIINKPETGLTNIPNGTSMMPSPTNAILPKMVSSFKRFTNRECKFSIWQRSFHDHVIRNEREYQKIWEYIDTNPMKWEQDCFHPSRNIETP